MSDEDQPQAKTAAQERIERMDKVAESLLKRAEDDKTSDVQKGRLFAQVMAWYKAREKLVPKGEGDKLKEMADGLKSKSGGRNRTPRDRSPRSADGRAIENIIRNLPSRGRPADGDPKSVERPGGGAPGDASGLRINGGGDGGGDVDGAGDGAVL